MGAFGLSIYVFAPRYNEQLNLLHHTDGTIFNAQEALKGKIALVYFGYSFCPDVCPISLYALDEAYALMDETEKQKIQPIFVSLDPARDTPEILNEYKKSFDMPLITLRGDETTIKQIADMFGIKHEPNPPDDTGYYTMNHSNIFTVLSQYKQPSFITAFPSGDMIAKQIHKVIKEEETYATFFFCH